MYNAAAGLEPLQKYCVSYCLVKHGSQSSIFKDWAGRGECSYTTLMLNMILVAFRTFYVA
ncbi:hypothetical protein SAMN05216255_0066 [Pseudomonas segetis]|uniref:Uncharacterized protein n=1 Tax=Pseudomonas segetis TaxID=298908 RepID=A0A239JXA8_9PSED|nr:hypothetical protein SAMN05216255_0066 [Pseudomonas segetis]